MLQAFPGFRGRMVVVSTGGGDSMVMAYRGKKGCTSAQCTRLPEAQAQGMCFGWHCGMCDEPSGSQGCLGACETGERTEADDG